MAQLIHQDSYDVVVIGGGASGVMAAAAAAKNGAKTLLVDAGPSVGGELLSGIGVAGCVNSRGEWAVGGLVTELIEECDAMGGYVGNFNEWRLNWLVCLDPEIVKLALPRLLRRYGVNLLLYTFAEDVVIENGAIKGIIVLNKNKRTLITAKQFIDCSGDADIALLAGAPVVKGEDGGGLQPVSLVFRMAGLDKDKLFEFVRQHPENIVIGDNPIYPSKAQCIENLIKAGYPRVVFDGKGPLLSNAMASGEVYKTALISICPVSTQRREVSCNTTRIAHIDATDTRQLSNVLPDLTEQVWTGVKFLKANVPGFEHANFAGAASRIGIRETRRIVGEYVLTGDDCQQGRKFSDGIAKGCHHIDIHGEGTKQIRIPIENGGTYDIPFSCLVPKGIKNLLVSGRCMSGTREGNGTARVMGTVMATGQAAGTASAMAAQRSLADIRDLPVLELREQLKAHGAVLDGTH